MLTFPKSLAMRAPFHLLVTSLLLLGCAATPETPDGTPSPALPYDSHVHLMSPALIDYWKGLGIPFSRPAAHYADIDTILANNAAQHIDLIGMGYVYENPDYYDGPDARERLRAENDYLLRTAQKRPERITPFIAVNPLTDYALEEMDRCYARRPDSGLKLHFSTSQVYLTEPAHLQRVRRVFARAAAHGWPVLLHFDNWHPEFGRPDIELLADSILADLPALQLRIAHFGTSGGFNEKTKRFLDAFLDCRDQGRFPTRHQLLLDISAVALDKDSEGVSKLTDAEFADLRRYVDRIGAAGIVFGTDYPLYRSEEYLHLLEDKLGLTTAELRMMGARRGNKEE